MLIKQKDFDLFIKESLPTNNLYSTINEVYFNDEYKNELKKILVDTDTYNKYKKNEFTLVGNKNAGLTKMCSVASSSRLAFMYFYDDIISQRVIMEYECDNGLNKGYYPQLDVFDTITNTYYECKCHEICNKHSSKLSIKYKRLLCDLFALKSLNENSGYINISLGELGIDNNKYNYDLNDSIYNLCFDIKQFMCHLIGIYNAHKCKCKLQYIFFTPSKILVKSNFKLKELYNILNKEWEMIISSKSISYFINNNKDINIKDPIYIQVSDINDIVLNHVLEVKTN